MQTKIYKQMIGFVAVGAAVLASGSATAVPLTFAFTGEVTGVAHHNAGIFAANFAVGDPITGKFTFESTALPLGTAPEQAAYPATFSATVSGHDFGGPAEYRIFNDIPPRGDGFQINNDDGTFTGPVLGGLVPTTFFIQFVGMPPSTLADTSLVVDPVSIFPLYDPFYAPHGLRMDNPADGAYGLLTFSVDNLTRVPDSGGLSLLGIGMLALLGFERLRGQDKLISREA